MWRLSLFTSLAFTLSGCFVGTVGAVIGILAAVNDSGGDAPDVPRVVNLRLEPGPESPSRPDDLRHVRIRFDLAETTAEPAEVRVEFSAGAAAGVIDEGLKPTSAAGTAQAIEWNALASGLKGFQQAAVRVTARDGDGEGFGASATFAIGNDAPVVTDIRLCERGAGSLSQNVVVAYELADSAGDPSRIRFFVVQDGALTEVKSEDVQRGRPRRSRRESPTGQAHAHLGVACDPRHHGPR
jgi:hypothetical protein